MSALPGTEPSTYPQDIFNMVIDELQPDSPSLHSCSLVSRPWLHTSRVHLFRKVTISVGDANDTKDIKKFLHSLANHSTGFPYFIRALAIEGYATSGRLSRPRLYPPLHSGDLFGVLDSLPNLHTLTLDHAKFISDPPDIKNSQGYTSLGTFKFCTTLQEGPYDYKTLFLQLLLHFPNVTELDLSFHSSPTLEEYPITFAHEHPRHTIKSLKLEASASQGPELQDITSQLAGHDTLPCLTAP